MVKKLFKYEAAAYLRVWAPIELAVIALALFCRTIQIIETDTVAYELLFSGFIGIYVLGIVASIIFNHIFAFIRYYKNLFASEGYLSFTLPVTAGQHVFVKITTSVAFTVASVIMAFISFMIVSAGDMFLEVMKAIGYLSGLAIDKVGANFGLYIAEAVVLLILSFATIQMVSNTCISIGQKANKGRIGFAFLAYFIYNSIIQIIATVVQFVLLLIPEDWWNEVITKHYIPLIHTGFGIIIVVEVLIVLVCFLVSRRIITKRLNLI